jgi:acetyl esterase/lipase
MKITRDIVYLGPDRKHTLDLYEPDAPAVEPRPGIVVIHGGGWRVGDKANERETQMCELAVNAGWVAVSINYMQIQDQSPPWPAYLNDARAATNWLRRHAGVDPKRIGAIGGSAGGNMSLLLGERADGFDPVQAVVALYPPVDMTWASGKDRSALFGDSTEARDAASPLVIATRNFPPTFLLHGTDDKTVGQDHSERMAARLKELGVKHKLLIVEGAPHTFKLSNEQWDLRPTVAEFFAEHL